MLLILVFYNLDQDLHYQTTTSLPPIVMSFDLGWVAPPASLSSACRFVDDRAWDFPVSKVTLTTSYNKSPFLSFYLSIHPSIHPVQIRSVAQSCLTLCDPMNCSTPGLPVHHQLPEFTQTHVHRVSDAIQPSQPLSSPSPPAPNPSQHQTLFQ